MKTLVSSILAAGFGLMLSSCYYDSYGYGGSYSGYSDSYGFSGGTAFIHTSSDRWFYDPGVRCYYDRHRSCYYDPWLNGYYPRGYCPLPVSHVPHPYGWSGRGACPIPRGVNSRFIDRYQDRIALLRAQNHEWARRVKAQQTAQAQQWRQARARAAANYAQNRQQPQPSRITPRTTPAPATGIWGNRPARGSDTRYEDSRRGRDQNRSARQGNTVRPPSMPRAGYNTPVSRPSSPQQQRNSGMRNQNQDRQASQRQSRPPQQTRSAPPQRQQHGNAQPQNNGRQRSTQNTSQNPLERRVGRGGR